MLQGEFRQKTIHVAIGSPTAWSSPQAEEKVRELQRQIDEDHDPRGVKRPVVVAAVEKKALPMR